MAKRGRKPGWDIKQGQEWLQRYESGESLPHIAERDGFDVRTVRKHVESAKQEREAKENRAVVLRNALEEHYRDLCKYADKLSELRSGESAAESAREEYIHAALRQHLPRSPVWGYLKQRDFLKQKIDQLRQEAGVKLQKAVESNSRLSAGLDIGETGVVPGIVVALTHQIEQWAMGHRGRDVENQLFEDKTEGEYVLLRYGFSQMGMVKKERVGLIRDVLRDLESHIKRWEVFKTLEGTYMEQGRVEKNLKDELAVISLRRVVPGRCRYCPL